MQGETLEIRSSFFVYSRLTNKMTSIVFIVVTNIDVNELTFDDQCFSKVKANLLVCFLLLFLLITYPSGRQFNYQHKALCLGPNFHSSSLDHILFFLNCRMRELNV